MRECVSAKFQVRGAWCGSAAVREYQVRGVGRSLAGATPGRTSYRRTVAVTHHPAATWHCAHKRRPQFWPLAKVAPRGCALRGPAPCCAEGHATGIAPAAARHPGLIDGAPLMSDSVPRLSDLL